MSSQGSETLNVEVVPYSLQNTTTPDAQQPKVTNFVAAQKSPKSSRQNWSHTQQQNKNLFVNTLSDVERSHIWRNDKERMIIPFCEIVMFFVNLNFGSKFENFPCFYSDLLENQILHMEF